MPILKSEKVMEEPAKAVDPPTSNALNNNLIEDKRSSIEAQADHHPHSHSKFDIFEVIQHFQKALVDHDDTDVFLEHYILAWKELNKIFHLLGRIFSFVESDVAEKESILQLLLDHNPKQYKTIKSMLSYEAAEKERSKKSKEASRQSKSPTRSPLRLHFPSLHLHHHHLHGARTLLRLHRALEFIVQLVEEMRGASPDLSMAHITRVAYDQTMGKYHPWLVRKGVHLAVYTLPARQQLITNLAGQEDPNDDHVEEALMALVNSGKAVHDKIQAMYVAKDMLSL